MKLIPAIKDYIWGGSKLKSLYSKKSNTDTIAESWEFSVHSDGITRTEDGTPLTRFLNAKKLGNYNGDQPQIMIKLIDAQDNLSVQVHPNDHYAHQFDDNGKREMWYIVDSEPNAGIYCGLKNAITQQQLQNALQQGTILDLLNFFPVKKGDCFFIEAGTIHAIGKGVTIYELQQSSNLTYRLYDYNRLGADGKPRQLHIDNALSVATLDAYNVIDRTPYLQDQPQRAVQWLGGCKEFTAALLTVQDAYPFKTDSNSFAVLTVVEGNLDAATKLQHKTTLKLGQSYFVPALESVELKGNAKVIVATVAKYGLRTHNKDKQIQTTLNAEGFVIGIHSAPQKTSLADYTAQIKNFLKAYNLQTTDISIIQADTDPTSKKLAEHLLTII